MSIYEFVTLLQAAAWPAVALIAILVIRPHLSALMANSKLTLSIAGNSFETTLPELQEAIREHDEGKLTEDHLAYLDSLYLNGIKEYAVRMDKSARIFLRPLRNSGLIATVPKNAYLADATAVQLSALGRLYMRAMHAKAPRRAVAPATEGAPSPTA